MTTFSEPSPSTDNTDDTCQSVSEIIYTHFDSYQRDGGNKNVSRAAEALHHDVLSFVLSNKNHEDGMTDEQVSEEVAAAVTRCIDAAMSAIAVAASGSKKDTWSESVTSILELASAYATAGKDELVARTVIDRVIEFLSVEKDAIRTESCNMLGWCVRHLVESSKPAASILKKKGGKNGAPNNNNNKRVNDAAGWKLECLLDIGKALQPRLTDKIAKVRSAAISACVPFFSEGAKVVVGLDSKDFEKIITSIQNTLTWIMSNDSSAPNRALVAQSGRVSEETIPYIIERVKDVDVKVREAALDSLRENVNADDLTEDQRVEILRYGLTKRCVFLFTRSTHPPCHIAIKTTNLIIYLLSDAHPPMPKLWNYFAQTG
jgi:hypothetical protein